MVTEVPQKEKFESFTSHFHTVHMCEHNYELCFNSYIQRTCTKLFSNIFHVFTSTLTHFRLETKNKMDSFCSLQAVDHFNVCYTKLFIYLCKNVDFGKLSNILYCFFKNSQPQIFVPRFRYERNNLFPLKKNHVFIDRQTFLVRTALERI